MLVLWNCVWPYMSICRGRERDGERESETERRGCRKEGKEMQEWKKARYGGTLPVGICFSVCSQTTFPCNSFYLTFFFTLFHQLLSGISRGNTLGWLTTQYWAYTLTAQCFSFTCCNNEHANSSLFLETTTQKNTRSTEKAILHEGSCVNVPGCVRKSALWPRSISSTASPANMSTQAVQLLTLLDPPRALISIYVTSLPSAIIYHPDWKFFMFPLQWAKD